MLHEYGPLLAGSGDPLQDIVDRLRGLAGIDAVGFLTLAEPAPVLRAASPPGAQVLAAAASDPVVVAAGRERRAISAEGPARLALPVVADGEIHGVLLAAGSAAALGTRRDVFETVASLLGAFAVLDARLAETRRQADLLEILSAVSRVALESDDLFQLMQRTVDFICGRLPVAIASILLLDQSGESFVVEAYSGDLELRLPAGKGWPISVGACGRCVRFGKPQLLLDVHADPDYVVGNPAVVAEYMVPIRYRERILGVLNLESTRRDTFTPAACRVFDALADQIAGAIHLAGINRRLEQANEDLERLTALDPLTGIPNRRRFDAALDAEWRRACRTGRPLAVILADIDCFKALNDHHGHPYGDDCLRKVAHGLQEIVRRTGDTVGRYGGEEFAIVLADTGPEEAREQAERLRQAVAGLALTHAASTAAPVVTLSLGVASASPAPGGEAQQLVRAADEALYAAKNAGRNRVVLRSAALPSQQG